MPGGASEARGGRGGAGLAASVRGGEAASSAWAAATRSSSSSNRASLPPSHRHHRHRQDSDPNGRPTHSACLPALLTSACPDSWYATRLLFLSLITAPCSVVAAQCLCVCGVWGWMGGRRTPHQPTGAPRRRRAYPRGISALPIAHAAAPAAHLPHPPTSATPLHTRPPPSFISTHLSHPPPHTTTPPPTPAHLLLGAGDDALQGVGDLVLGDLLQRAPRRQDGRLVHQVGQVGACSSKGGCTGVGGRGGERRGDERGSGGWVQGEGKEVSGAGGRASTHP